jgi:hypothetical protein
MRHGGVSDNPRKKQLFVENNSHKAKIILRYGMLLGIKSILALT